MNSQEIIQIETEHSSGTYTKQPLVIVRGQGASLFDIDGVLVEPSGYRAAVQATLHYFTRRMGL